MGEGKRGGSRIGRELRVEAPPRLKNPKEIWDFQALEKS